MNRLERRLRAKEQRKHQKKMFRRNKNSKSNTTQEYWRKTQGDIWEEYKNTPTGNIPFFDFNYWTKQNPDYVEGVSVKTSKEMMEYFLRTISHPQVSISDERVSQYKMVWWFAWRNLLDTDSTNEDDEYCRNYEPFKWFNDLEYLITNDEIFYVLIQPVWLYGSHLLTNKEEMFSRYGRSKVSFDKKMEMGDFLSTGLTLSGKEKFKDGSSTSSHNGLSSEFIKGHLDDFADDDYITVFRSSVIRKGKPVRNSRQKYMEDEKSGETVINPEYFQQDEGKGWSYSAEKTIAIRLGWNINSFHFEKYLGMNTQTALNHMVKEKHITETQKGLARHTSGHQVCLGRYRVKKKDILIYTDARHEKELIIDPKNVLLEDYYFLNLIDFITMRVSFDLETSILLSHNKEDGNTINIDDLYAPMRPVVSKYCERNPDELVEYLKNNANKKNRIKSKLFDEFQNAYDFSKYGYYPIDEKEGHNTYMLLLGCDEGIVRLNNTGKNDFRPSKHLFQREVA